MSLICNDVSVKSNVVTKDGRISLSGSTLVDPMGPGGLAGMILSASESMAAVATAAIPTSSA